MAHPYAELAGGGPIGPREIGEAIKLRNDVGLSLE